MIIGTGIDMELVERFSGKNPSNSGRFLRKIFTDEELNYSFLGSSSDQHLAARFAAKEATIKALQSISHRGVLTLKEIEVVMSHKIPAVVIHSTLYSDITLHLSLTHTSNMAAAIVIAELTKKKNGPESE
jgi:holo-[acyl-carrier protein] synthase